MTWLHTSYKAAMPPIYRTLDLQVTLRCNFSCKNCIEFSSMKGVTGLDYSDSDMTWTQITRFADQVMRLRADRPVIGDLFITGGEPLLHPEIDAIADFIQKEMVKPGLVARMLINSNLLIPASASLAPHIINFTPTTRKHLDHDTVLVHPSEFGTTPTFKTCGHYRKWRPVLNHTGYSMCCAGDGYIRLFGLDHLIIDELPNSPLKFPLDRMDDVCQHCPFGVAHERPKEPDVGRPVSKIYAQQAELNRQGRRSSKVF